MADPSVTVNASQPSCEGTCTLNSMDQPDTQNVDTQRCAVNGTLASSTGMFCNCTVNAFIDGNNY